MLGTADRVVPARVACAAMIQQDDGGMDHASSLISQGARPQLRRFRIEKCGRQIAHTCIIVVASSWTMPPVLARLRLALGNITHRLGVNASR